MTVTCISAKHFTCGLIATAGVAANSTALAQQYTLIDLGTLTDRSSWGHSINQRGDVCGWSSISGTPGTAQDPAIPFINHAFVWSNGTMTDLGAIPSAGCSPLGCESRADDINDDGLIVGWSATPYQIPFVWSDKNDPPLVQGLNPLPSLFAGNGNSVARAINFGMFIAGECKGPGGIPRRPVKWFYDGVQWTVTDLGTLMPDNTGYGGAYDINSPGDIVGQATHAGGSLSAFLWLHEPMFGLEAGMHDLTPTVQGATALAINDQRQIIGVIGIAQGFLWLPEPAYGMLAGLNLLPLYDNQFYVYPSGINNRGEIVGTAFIVQGQTVINRGVMFLGGKWVLIDDLLPAGSPWTIINYSLNADINDAGAITGDMRSTSILDINGFPAIHGFVLKPIVPGDIDGDGHVNSADLAQLLATWGQCPAKDTCTADLNNDGRVGPADLAQLLAHWG